MKANRIFFILASTVLFLASCDPPTEEEIREEFNQAVGVSNYCSVDEDCVVVHPGCPLGCGAAVNVVHETEIKNLAKKLIFEWQLGGRGCEYSCPTMTAVCTEGTCEAIESDETETDL